MTRSHRRTSILHRRRPAILAGTLLCAAVLASCRRDDITVRRVPKETAAPMSVSGPAGMAPAAPDNRGATWTAPAGWTSVPPSQMRVASYTVPGAAGPVDVSIVPLAGEAGGELANINRWRGQLGLAPVTDADLPSITRRVQVGPYPALLVEFSSSDAPPKRLLAAVIVHDGDSWFFKALGPDAAVTGLKSAFLRFAGSLRFPHDH